MKTLVLIATFLTFSNSYASNFLNEDQASTVLNSIDNICGDTWCEGDFDFSFDNISCSSVSASCDIRFSLILVDYDLDLDKEIIKGKFTTTCNVKGASKYEDMIDVSSEWSDLSLDFYQNLTDCISDKEEIARIVLGMNY